MNSIISRWLQPEQDQLISTLRAHESTSNARYNLILSALPLTLTLPILYHTLYSTASTPAPLLACFLAITSLLASAYMMRYIPVTGTGAIRQPSTQRQPLFIASDGPIHLYLPYLNGAICALLAMAAWGFKGRTDVDDGFWLFLLLPPLILGIITVARRSMADIQSGIGELEGLKYEYKGA